MKSIVILIHYFGQFPEWAPLFFETLKRNSTITFIFYTDCDISKYITKNIEVRKIKFNEYIANVKKCIGVNFNPINAYKLCDLRPLYPVIHYEEIKSYNFYGWLDVDLLLGNIRDFYTDDLLSKYDVFSTHHIRISGHLALFKNTGENREMYKKIYDWKNKLLNKSYMGMDEHGLFYAYTMTIFDKINQKFKLNFNNSVTKYFSKKKCKNLYLEEQYTTPFTLIPWLDGTINSHQPDVWFYKNGNIFNNRDIGRNFIYLHMMNFKSSKWRHDNTKAPWEELEGICNANEHDLESGIIIDKNGIRPYKVED